MRIVSLHYDLRWASQVMLEVRNPPANAGDMIQSLGQKDTLEEEMATHSSILAWKILMDRGAWPAAYSPLGCKESDTTEQLNTYNLR